MLRTGNIKYVNEKWHTFWITSWDTHSLPFFKKNVNCHTIFDIVCKNRALHRAPLSEVIMVLAAMIIVHRCQAPYKCLLLHRTCSVWKVCFIYANTWVKRYRNTIFQRITLGYIKCEYKILELSLNIDKGTAQWLTIALISLLKRDMAQIMI